MGWLTPWVLGAAFLFHYVTSLFRSEIYTASHLLLVVVFRRDYLQMLPLGTTCLEEFEVGTHEIME